jgi:prolyl-tRNA editing enzyme YbaK/EbsC (Cys-tRNA(Pro) deacylase)
MKPAAAKSADRATLAQRILAAFAAQPRTRLSAASVAETIGAKPATVAKACLALADDGVLRNGVLEGDEHLYLRTVDAEALDAAEATAALPAAVEIDVGDMVHAALDPVGAAEPSSAPKAKPAKATTMHAYGLTSAYEVALRGGGDTLVAMRATLDVMPAEIRRAAVRIARTKVLTGSAVDEALRALHDELPADAPGARARSDAREVTCRVIRREQRAGRPTLVATSFNLPPTFAVGDTYLRRILDDGSVLLTPIPRASTST